MLLLLKDIERIAGKNSQPKQLIKADSDSILFENSVKIYDSVQAFKIKYMYKLLQITKQYLR